MLRYALWQCIKIYLNGSGTWCLKFLKEHLVLEFFLSSCHPLSLCWPGRWITLLWVSMYHLAVIRAEGALYLCWILAITSSFTEQIHVLVPLSWDKGLNISKQRIKTQSAIKTQQFVAASLPCFPPQFILLSCLLTLNHSIIQLRGWIWDLFCSQCYPQCTAIRETPVWIISLHSTVKIQCPTDQNPPQSAI